MSHPLKLAWTKVPNYRGFAGYERRQATGSRYVGSVLYGGVTFELADQRGTDVGFVPKNNRSTRFPVDDRALFDWANMAPTEDGAIDFLNKWGLPERSGSVSLSQLGRVAAEIWGCLALLCAQNKAELVRRIGAEVNLPVARRRLVASNIRLSSHSEPESLQDFCFLRLMQMLENNERVYRCPRPGCGAFYSRQRYTRKACSGTCSGAIRQFRDTLPDPENDDPNGRKDIVSGHQRQSEHLV